MDFDVIDFVLTLSAFTYSTALLPLVLLSYFLIKISHNVWYWFISVLHPELEFIKHTTLRTLVETHRNQGIITILLTLRGPANVHAIKMYLQEVVRRKDKQGSLVFPRLRDSLVTRFGTYAWLKATYSLDYNLIEAPTTFKGRTISEFNIQDCVSDIVSKYLPAGVPPWQVVVIPSTEHQHYVIFRFHHLILSEGLNIADLLPLIPPVRSNIECPETKSPLRNVFKCPESIPKLRDRLTEDLTNSWNEFISNYDPMERPELLKCTPGFFQFLGISLITTVLVVKECKKGLRVIPNDAFIRLKFLIQTIHRETSKRGVSIQNLFFSVCVTLDPRNIIKFIIKNCWYISVTATVKIPFFIYNELKALHTCISLQYCAYPNTTIGFLYNYLPLFYRSVCELGYCFQQFYKAPRNIIEELCSSTSAVQTVTLCGRKAVAWSEPIPTAYVKHIAQKTNSSETEVYFAACSTALSRYLTQTNEKIPKEIAITARNISSNYMFHTGTNVKPYDSFGGVICMNLPIINSEKEGSIVDNLNVIKKNLSKSLDKQSLTYLYSILQTKYGFLSKVFPATAIGIFLKYLSLKYSVSFTEVTSRYPNVTQRTVWGQEVMSVIYWRPPQANISISLCLNEYADHVIMGVMCDQQLVPNHSTLARNFSQHLGDIALVAGIAKI